MVTEAERSRYRTLLYKATLTQEEWREYHRLNDKINMEGTQVERVAPAAPVSDTPILTKMVWRRIEGRMVQVEEIDAARMAERSMAQMTTHQPTNAPAAPGSAEEYSRAHFRSHIHHS